MTDAVYSIINDIYLDANTRSGGVASIPCLHSHIGLSSAISARGSDYIYIVNPAEVAWAHA